jgi:hypothetical protein
MIEAHDHDAYLAEQVEIGRERNELLVYVQSLGYADFTAMSKDAIEKDATEYAEREYAKLDDPALSDIELWERYLGIDDLDIRKLFDERLVLKRGGIEVEELWNDHRLHRTRSGKEAADKAMFAEYAAELRNPAPNTRVPSPEEERLTAFVLDELYTRVALKKWLCRARHGALRAGQMHEYFEREAEQRRQSKKHVLLATPVTIEGEIVRSPRAY